MLLTCEIVCGTSLVAISDAFFDQPVRPLPPEEAQPAESAVNPSMHPDEFPHREFPNSEFPNSEVTNGRREIIQNNTKS